MNLAYPLRYGGRSLNVEIASARAGAVDFQLFVPQKNTAGEL